MHGHCPKTGSGSARHAYNHPVLRVSGNVSGGTARALSALKIAEFDLGAALNGHWLKIPFFSFCKYNTLASPKLCQGCP
jgi:hypothetical protein